MSQKICNSSCFPPLSTCLAMSYLIRIYEEIEESGELPLFDEEAKQVFPEEYFLYEPEELEGILAFIQTITQELIERTLPESKRILTLEKAAQCLSLLGKIWNLTECHEGCEIDSVKCQTSDERLLDMEGYVEEYQYLHLEAVDLALSDIRIIPQHFIWLLSVDVSGNRLTNISAFPLTKLPNLVTVKLNRNRIADPYLEPMKHLQYLGMNSNKIESLHRIYHPNLLTLDVTRNVISKIDGMDCWKLQKLRQLELRGNRLKTTAGMEYENLEELYLAENEIQQMEGMEFLPKLKRLHLRNNPLSDLSGFELENNSLEYLNLRSCQIEDEDELRKLQVLKGLTVLIITDNKFNPAPEVQETEENEGESEDDADLRIRILTMLPKLKRINKKSVTREEMKIVNELLEEQ